MVTVVLVEFLGILMPLAVQIACFHTVEEENRKCHLCDLQVEMHFIFHCPVYHDLHDNVCQKYSSSSLF